MKEKLEKLPFYNSAVLPYHFAQALFAGLKFGFPAKSMRVIGVTGTNGKTTTCFMIWKMLNEAGIKTGIMTTVAWGVKTLKPEYNHMTTVDSFTLNERISQIKKQGTKVLVLEVTSHAMAQFRTLGIPVEIAVMTNVTHDHLDYHKTFENYRNAKRKLFKKAKFGVINADDESGKFFADDVKWFFTYGVRNGQKRAENIRLSSDGVEFNFDGMKIWTPIPGEFNVYNAMAAVCVGERMGLSQEQIEKGIAALDAVEGRMTKIDEGQNFDVIVDYAHTPDALDKVFNSLGKIKGNIIAIHGGAGRRDESTRKIRGEILGKYADIVVITEDDSRDEDPAMIAKSFVQGSEKSGKILGKNLFVEMDRKKAIETAFAMAKKGDLVLILGKGHEKTILKADGPHDFEDIKVAKEVLRNR